MNSCSVVIEVCQETKNLEEAKFEIGRVTEVQNNLELYDGKIKILAKLLIK
jgi:hypothetical protein